MSHRVFMQRIGRLERCVRRRVEGSACPCCGGPHRVHLPRVLSHCGVFEDDEDPSQRYVFCQHCGKTARGKVERQHGGALLLTGAVAAEIPYI